MEKSKEEKELFAVSWPTFLTVTGISLFMFSFALKLLDGHHMDLFLYAGTISLGLGIITWILTPKT